MAMTTRAYPKIVVRGRRVNAPSPTRAAEQSTTIPRATAVGGIAAFSAGVRVRGARGQPGGGTQGTAAAPETAAQTPAAVPVPPPARVPGPEGGGGARHHDPEAHRRRRNSGFLGGRQAEGRREPAGERHQGQARDA